MKIYLSVASSHDGYIDDCSSSRLVLSTPEDWEEIYELRARFDAILVGAETLRKDNPSLRIKSEALRQKRVERQMDADITRIVITASGELPTDAKFFTGEGRAIVITTSPNFSHPKAEVILMPEISVEKIVEALTQRGIESLFVEGGCKTLRLFLESGMVQTIRHAINQSIAVNDCRAPKFDITPYVSGAAFEMRNVGGMIVTTYDLTNSPSADDQEYMSRAVNQSRMSQPCATAYRVGAVVVTADGTVYEGYTHENSPTSHAEQEAVRKAERCGANLHGATIYSSMEPCTSRKSEPESCSQLIIRHRFARVVFALYEPSHLAICEGASMLVNHGITVAVMPSFADEVRQINSHICNKQA